MRPSWPELQEQHLHLEQVLLETRWEQCGVCGTADTPLAAQRAAGSIAEGLIVTA